jgi:dipeptidyl-peptidase-4
MEWASNNEVAVQQLNRKQNTSILYYANILTGEAKNFYKENNDSWIDIKSRWHDDDPAGWDWINNKSAFLWMTEKDGWRHLYSISKDGKSETLVTKGNYDVIDLLATDEKEGYVYFLASPENATQQYLYRTKLDGSGSPELLSPANQKGTHEYDISPTGKYATHTFSNANTFPVEELIALPSNTVLGVGNAKQPAQKLRHVDFFQVTTADNITMDGWIVKPDNFDSAKKYPVVFMVYTEPAGATVTDKFGTGRNDIYAGNMQADGYIYISLDGRGTPAPKGAAWRKSIYKNVGIINIRDQAEAAKKILQWQFIDTSRVAVWGWSGGGSTTLNLMFQYPEIYKTGIAIAPVANQLTYDNIYEERYMGLPQEDNAETYKKGSPITYAKGLQGNLLLVHGTGDDNVHYQNSEMLINQLIKYNKIFQFMPYPNRSHGIFEGEGTRKHLSTIYTNYLKTFCPPGGR